MTDKKDFEAWLSTESPYEQDPDFSAWECGCLILCLVAACAVLIGGGYVLDFLGVW